MMLIGQALMYSLVLCSNTSAYVRLCSHGGAAIGVLERCAASSSCHSTARSISVDWNDRGTIYFDGIGGDSISYVSLYVSCSSSVVFCSCVNAAQAQWAIGIW